MNKTLKIVLGIATLLPIAYFIFFIVFIMSNVAISVPSNGHLPINKMFPVIFSLHLMTMLWIFVLLGIYIINVFKNDRVEKDKKALWAVVLFLGNMISMPIYWYLYIWREPKKI